VVIPEDLQARRKLLVDAVNHNNAFGSILFLDADVAHDIALCKNEIALIDRIAQVESELAAARAEIGRLSAQEDSK
jgi:hypothetical protein